MKSFYTFTIIVSMAVFLQGCAIPAPSQNTSSLLGEKSLEIETGSGSVGLMVEVADTDEARRIGYMFREEVPEGTGMWFVFENESTRSFWMKNTPVPLDMIFVSVDLEIVDIAKNSMPCEKDPCPSYVSKTPAMYVLEVPAGFSEKRGIENGNKIKFK